MRVTPVQFLQPVVIAIAMLGGSCLAAENDSLNVTVRDIAGKTHFGPLSSVDEKRLVVTGKTKSTIAMRDVFRIDFSRKSSATISTGPSVLLSTGDRVAVTPTKIDAEDLHGTWTGLPDSAKARIPLMSVRAIVFIPHETRTEQQRLLREIREHAKPQDVVILRNGDRVTGTFKSLDANGAQISGTTATIRRADIRAILFNPTYLQKPKPADKTVRLQLADGSTLSARNVVYQLPNAIDVTPFFGGRVTIPLSSVATIQYLGNRVTPLSERKPAVYEFTPYIAGSRPLQSNRNVLGGRLMLRGKPYGIGLGMRSRSRVTYDLTGSEQSFLATIGIDDAAKGKGHAVFVVELDGKPVYQSPVLTGKSPPQPIGPIALNGHKRLTLIVDYGPFGDVLDYADWCDAVLIGK